MTHAVADTYLAIVLKYLVYYNIGLSESVIEIAFFLWVFSSDAGALEYVLQVLRVV